MFAKWRKERELNKEIERKQQNCFHKWEIADFYFKPEMYGSGDRMSFKLGCKKCSKFKDIDEYQYRRMNVNGLIES